MVERIILASGLDGNSLIKNLALHGINSFKASTGEDAEYLLKTILQKKNSDIWIPLKSI